MTRFYMTKTADHDEKYDDKPFAINLDYVVLAEPVEDFTMIKLAGDDNDWYCIKERYEDFIKNLTPFVPFNEMVKNSTGADSGWLHNYLKDTQKGVPFANNNNG